MAQRTAEEGRFQVPSDWPKWKKRCGAKRSNGTICNQWAIVGMPTCKYHGSGGERNRELGEIRYLCWVITGGPQNQPVEHACRVALSAFCEAVFNQGKGTVAQQMKAAMWLTDRGR